MISEMHDGTDPTKLDMTKISAVYNPGSKRDWIDDTVNPQDAMTDFEVEADIFYDFFLSIPNIKSIKRFKDYEHEWLAKLEVLATAIPDGSKWVETAARDPKKVDLSKMITSKALEELLKDKRKEVELTPEEMATIPKEDLIDVSRKSWIRAGSRYFKPAVVEGEKKAQDLMEEVKRFDFGNHRGDHAKQILEDCAAAYKKYSVANSTASVLETKKKYKLSCDNFGEEMPKYMPQREDKKNEGELLPDPFKYTHAMFKDFAKIPGKIQERKRDDGSDDGNYEWNLDRSDREKLWQAWKNDQEREKLIKSKKDYDDKEKEIKDSWYNRCWATCFPPHKDWPLTEIHDDALKLQTTIAKLHLNKARGPLQASIKNKVSGFGAFDAHCFKFCYAILVNFVVIFLIVAIMNTIGSGGLPGRQQLHDKTSFQVILKVKGDVSNTDRFDKPKEIFDVCQGLGWWMQDDSIFSSQSYDWPIAHTSNADRTTNPLFLLAKQHWDPLLNDANKCPDILAGFAGKLGVSYFSTNADKGCSGAEPDSETWIGDVETQEYLLFQDQGVKDRNGGFEVMKPQGLVLTNKKSGKSKEFTLMSGNFNGKVQQLQPMDPLDPMSAGGANALFKGLYKDKDPYRADYVPFWRALDRIWPSEWAVQALFSLNVNSNVNGNSQYDEKKIVGGYNSFGRRPTAIVQANVGGGIGGVNSHGEMIEEAIWQFLERRCWHKSKFSNRQPVSLTPTPIAVMQEYSPLSQYDRSLPKLVRWDNLDQGLRDYWRGLGLGLDTTACQGGQLRSELVKDDLPCISGKTECTRVNYHSVQRWSANNIESIATNNFNERNFTSIFFSYDCEGQADGSPPKATPRTWDKIELAEDVGGKLLAAASNLGYDAEEWNSHSQFPRRKSGPPDNLVLTVENYLEGEAYLGTFWWTQVCCILIMICVSMPEIRNLILWGFLLPPPDGPRTDSLWPHKIVYTWYVWALWWWSRKGNEKINEFTKAFLVRLASMIIAIASYVIIPVLLVMVSVLLILESGSVLDVIKDTLSLLFLNEINNYLQVRNAPDGFKWTIKLTLSKAVHVQRKKNIFSFLLVTCFAALAAAMTKVVYTGSAAYSGSNTPQGGGIKIHPSILFNLARIRGPWDGFVSWAVFVLLLAMVAAVYFVAQLVVKAVELFEKREAPKAGTISDRFGKFIANAFDDSKTYDDNDWYDDAVAYDELAAALEAQEAEELRQAEIKQKQEEEAARLKQTQAEEAARVARFFAEEERPPPPKIPPPAPEPTMLMRGVWKSQVLDGRMMEVLIHEDDGKMMASRIPGDPSGTVRWYSTAELVVNSSGPSSGMPNSVPSPMFRLHEA